MSAGLYLSCAPAVNGLKNTVFYFTNMYCLHAVRVPGQLILEEGIVLVEYEYAAFATNLRYNQVES